MGRLKALESVSIWYDFLIAIDGVQKRDYLEEARLDSSVQPKIITDRDFISVGLLYGYSNE